uniref:Chitin-binding type-4 domain-containing protein n=1 Tax=Magallana gigas TaxID=29159 RepID=A0A8W8P1H4_MAGGI
MGNPMRELMLMIVLLLSILQKVITQVTLIDPPGRSTLWRQGFNSAVNHHDDQLFCGGYRNFVRNGGKCGVCGDPYQGPLENEAGGKYAIGIISKHYDGTAKYINVTIEQTVFKKGYYEFRICPNNDVNNRVKQECLDQYLLQIYSMEYFPFDDGKPTDSFSLIPGNTQYFPEGRGIHNLRLGIPDKLTCTQCVLQWKYITGNHWGTSENRTSCYGCGFQETFINCADISIGNLTESNQPEEKLSESVPTKSSHISKRTTDLSPHLLAGFNVSGDGEECKRCYAVPTWDHYPGMNDWCDTNCRKGNCPPCRCYCGCPARHFENLCQGIGDDQGFQMDMWCWRECCEYECPLDKCRCNVNISETDIRSPRDGAITPPTKPNVNASVIGLKDAQMKTLEKLGARARPNVLSDNAQSKSPTFGLSSPKIIIFKPKERSIKDDDDKSTRRNNANSAPEIKSPDVPYQIETRETEDIPSKLNSASELKKMTSTSSTTTTTSTTSTTMTAYTTTEISTTTPKTFLSKKKPLKTTNLTSKPRLSFDNPLEITGQDPTGIPLEGLTSSLFGQFFLTKVDLEKELDLQKDVEYTPNKVSNFFNLEDPYQSYQPEVSVSVYTIGESEVTTANPTNNGEMLASSTIPPSIKSTTSFAFTNQPKTTTPEPIRLPSYTNIYHSKINDNKSDDTADDNEIINNNGDNNFHKTNKIIDNNNFCKTINDNGFNYLKINDIKGDNNYHSTITNKGNMYHHNEKTNSQGGYSKQQPSHLDIKKPKIVFEPKKTLLTPKLKPRVDAGQIVDQSKFFGNSSSNINSNSSSNIHQIISVMVKDIISTKIKINDREPTSIPIVTAGNRIKNITEIYGKSSSNFKVSQFNSTVIPKDNGKIYMEEKLPTFEPYTPTNDTNSTNNKMFRDVKNVVHHNFVLDSLIENMANFLKNDESKIQFHLNEDHHDKKANNVLYMKEQIKERIDSSIMSNGDKLDLPAVVSDLNITESIAPQRTQSESQARLDLQNTVFDSNERSKTFERKNKNLNQGKLIRWFNINSKVYRTTPASDTVTEVTSRIQGTTPTSFPVLQTIPPFPTHAIPLRPTSQSTSLKSTLISLLPPPIPSKNLLYHRPGQNPADLPHPTVKVQGTSTQHVLSTTKSKTILADKRNPEWPDTPSSFPLSEHYFSLQALKPTDGHTTSASERLTTTTPTTKQTTTKQTTTKQTTTPQLSTVTPIFNMPGLSLGVTTPINKISQLFFPPDFTQKKSLTEIINSDPRIVEGVYTKDVYPPSREQINASDVILSTPYQLKDPVSRVPLFLKSTPSSILTTSSQRPLSEKVHKTRSSSPSLPTIHRVIKLMPSRKRNPTLQPNKGSESAILEKTSENPKPDLTLGSERSSSGIGNSKIQLSPAFTFSNGSALTTNVHRNTKEVRTFRNVGKDILKEIFKSPKVKKHEILSGKVKLPRGKNAVILDIGLLNKLMDTFKQWLTSMRLLVVEK